MKKNLLLLLLLLICATVAFFVIKNDQSDSSLDSLDRHFAVKDVMSIQKIFIADRQGSSTTLTRDKGLEWKLNGKESVRQEAINTLLQTIKDLELKYIPPKAAVPVAVKTIGAEGIKVEIYGKEDQLLKSYYVGGMTQDERGTYMIMDKSSQPYVMHVPHFEGGLLYRYWMQYDDWRDKRVFNENPDKIKKVSVNYPFQTNESFILEKSGTDYTIQPGDALRKSQTKPLKKGRVQAYLYQLEEKVAEDFESDHPRKDSIINSIPFCTIELQRSDNTTHTVDLFRERIQYQNTNETQYVDDLIVRYFALVNEEKFLLIQDRVFRDILRGYDYFYD